jgi:hypothetical protein
LSDITYNTIKARFTHCTKKDIINDARTSCPGRRQKLDSTQKSCSALGVSAATRNRAGRIMLIALQWFSFGEDDIAYIENIGLLLAKKTILSKMVLY